MHRPVAKALRCTLALLFLATALDASSQEAAPGRDMTPEHAASGKFRSHLEFQRSIVAPAPAPAPINGQSDTLSSYAAKCEAATGISVPLFNCSDGIEVPGQDTGPDRKCNFPNVLNGQCDPGSHFQVLPGRTANAAAVAHCRRVGLPRNGSTYNDIAVIQYNKQNGALCFYQALTNLPGDNIPPPADGAKWSDGQTHWIDPKGVEGIGCTGCHDNGGFIRSEYLAQLERIPGVTLNHFLPSESQGFDNRTTPVRYVGLDYATNRSWSIRTDLAPGDAGPSCTACHRIAVPNRMAFGRVNGTGAHFADDATAASQTAKNPHGPSSPIWMRPGQVTYRDAAHASADKYQACAVAFFNSGFTAAPQGCDVEPLGEPWMSGWEALGGTFEEAPVVVSWGVGRLDLFGRGHDKALYHKAWTGAAWQPSGTEWEYLGGNFDLAKPTAVAWGPNRFDVFGIGADKIMYHKAWTGTSWFPSATGWEALGGLLVSNPVAVSWGPNRIDLFALDAGWSLLHKAWTGNAWQPSQTGWEPLGGAFISPPTAASWGPNRIDIVGLGKDRALYHKAWTGNGWSPSTENWESLGGHFTSNPAMASWGPNRLDIVGVGSLPDRKLFHKAWTGSTWSPSPTGWEDLGGAFHKDQVPVAVSWGPNRLDIFGVGAGSEMFHKAWTGSSWNPSPLGWEGLGGVFYGFMPAVVSWGPNRTDVFGFGPEWSAYHKAWTGNGWNPP